MVGCIQTNSDIIMPQFHSLERKPVVVHSNPDIQGVSSFSCVNNFSGLMLARKTFQIRFVIKYQQIKSTVMYLFRHNVPVTQVNPQVPLGNSLFVFLSPLWEKTVPNSIQLNLSESEYPDQQMEKFSWGDFLLCYKNSNKSELKKDISLQMLPYYSLIRFCRAWLIDL